ncbi:MAG: hypothetical protein QXN71_04065 [Candidatus Aenigmatarchaeota archaeon]
MEPDERIELKQVRISALVFSLAGIGWGAVSYFLNYDTISVSLGIVLVIVILSVMKKSLGKRGRFFVGDVFCYLLFWLASWIFLFNMA